MSAESPETSTRRSRAEWLMPLLVLCAVAATFGRVVSFQFVFDDSALILTNPFIQSAENLPRFFTEHFWSGVAIAQKNYYRPLSLLWLLGNWKLFGPRPAGWHAECLLLHALNTLLVYLLARRLLQPRGGGAMAAGAAAALFGLHPLQAEVVSWISCFNDLLAALLLLSSFHAWINARTTQERAGTRGGAEAWYALSVTGYAAALLCKEPAALFPLLLLVYELAGAGRNARPGVAGESSTPGSRNWLGTLKLLAPFVLVAAVYLALRRNALGSLTTPQPQIISWRTEWLTLPSVLLSYLTHLVWPEGLSPFYDVPYVQSFTFAGVGLPLLALVLPVALATWAAWRSSLGRFAIAWMLLFAAPTLHLAVLPRGELVHDRYLYLPMAGLGLLAGLGVAIVMDAQPRREGEIARGREAQERGLFDATWVAGALAAGMMLVAGRQAGYWHDNFTLFLRGVRIAPSNGIAAGNLGIEFWKRGERDVATALFQRAATLNPDIFEADKKAGYSHYEAGRYAEAEQAFGVAVATRPGDAFSHLMLGLVCLKTGRGVLAVAEGRRAVALAPQEPGFHFGLGTILETTGDLAGARDAFRAELAIRKDHLPSQQELQRLDRILGAAPSQ